MASVYTYVEVDLDDFSTDELIEELKLRKLDDRQRAMLSECTLDEGTLATATVELIAGRKREALIWLERALPYEWRGRLTGGM